jgi:hypothetical protein
VRALFVTNQRKTEFYSAWARAMEKSGAKIFWISVGERWTQYLLSAGWNPACILDLSRLGPRWKKAFAPSTEEKKRVEHIDQCAEISLKNALIMDRELGLIADWNIESYGQIVALEIERFVLENDIGFAFGEDTWAPEIITSAVMQANGRHFHAPHTIRVPSQRFAFFPGIFQKRVDVLCDRPDEQHRAIARQALADLHTRGERPYYFSLNMNQNRLRKYWLYEAWRAITQASTEQFDQTLPSLRSRIERRLVSIASGAIAKWSESFAPAPTASDRPFALFLLQKQPESSVDVIGSPFTNQYEVIKALTRLLPFGWQMWVKEHPNAIGDRSLAYYRDLKRLPGVQLIDPFADTHALLSRAALTITISGTASLEAALMGRPAITIAEMYFGGLLLRNGFDPFSANHRDFVRLIGETESMRCCPPSDTIEEQLAWLIAQSFPGVISDPANLPSVTGGDNVQRVADATMAMLRQLSERPAIQLSN